MRRDLAVYRRLDSYQRFSYRCLGRYRGYLLPSCRTFYGGSFQSPAAHTCSHSRTSSSRTSRVSTTATASASGVAVLSNNGQHQHHHHHHHRRRLPHHSHIDLLPYRGFSSPTPPFLNTIINITTTTNYNNIGKLQQIRTQKQTKTQPFSSSIFPSAPFLLKIGGASSQQQPCQPRHHHQNGGFFFFFLLNPRMVRRQGSQHIFRLFQGERSHFGYDYLNHITRHDDYFRIMIYSTHLPSSHLHISNRLCPSQLS